MAVGGEPWEPVGNACSLPGSSCHCLFQENSWIFPTGSRSCLQTVSQQRPGQNSVFMLLACAGLWESSEGRLFLKPPLVWDCNFNKRRSVTAPLKCLVLLSVSERQTSCTEDLSRLVHTGLEQSAGMRTHSCFSCCSVCSFAPCR